MNNEIYQNIAWNIINLRQSQWLTQEQLAEKTSLSKYQIKRIEKGQGDTTLENINQLAQFFEVPIESLFQKEKKVDVAIKIREEILEKSPNRVLVKSYKKSFMGTGQIRCLDLPYNSTRSIRIEKGTNYEICVLAGSTTILTTNDMSLMESSQILTAQGHGSLRINNVHSQTARILIFAY
ncbi:MAG: helix-turn-helix transcriptional regulator [Bdellovibrionales bacterium]|nr:helix-turn-helix transcriptional regulator [Bdellovibrionales bacterium]